VSKLSSAARYAAERAGATRVALSGAQVRAGGSADPADPADSADAADCSDSAEPADPADGPDSADPADEAGRAPVGGDVMAGLVDVVGLFRERHAELVRLAALVVGDRATAEDVVQDVFARLCARDRLRDADQPLGYVRAAVLNRCRSVLRRRAVARRLGGVSDLLGADWIQDSAEHEAVLAEDRREVLVALAALPRRRREVLVLRYWLGLPEAEIAAVLGISPGTVKSTASRGLAMLARRLGEES
jgi:RNA polymerase sigma-70 factor (sigma-E family)